MRGNGRWLILAALLMACAAACGDDDSTPADTGHDDAIADGDGADADADADSSDEASAESEADAGDDEATAEDAAEETDDAAGDSGPPGTGVLCGVGVECEPGQDCCMSGGFTCVEGGGTCSGTRYECDGAEDCGTDVCCLTIAGSGCQGACDIATLCHEDDECGTGGRCCLLAADPGIRYRICMAGACPGS
jgi:hypothetical protein